VVGAPRGASTARPHGAIGPNTSRAKAAVRHPENHLIEQLPRKDRQHLLGQCEPVELALSEVLCEAGQATHHVYFPVDGFISLVALIDGHPGLEVGMVGREGMVGAPVSLGVPNAPLRALVQGAGISWRVDSGIFLGELRRSIALQKILNRYLYVRIAQLASAATCLRYHLIGPRLARWLLMSQDRAHTDHFHVTHECLSYMLGVRRVGVTVAAGALQHAGLISYRRGEVRVVDRAGLEAAACSCYATDRQTHARYVHR
jgi:CRP-like cAMP-binding protein